MFVEPALRFLLGMCVYSAMNANIGYMASLKNPLVVLLLSLIGAAFPWGAMAFLAGCFLLMHIVAVSLEMAFLAAVILLVVGVLYYSFKPGDSVLLLLTPLAFLIHIPYAIPLLVGLGAGLASVIPVGCGVLLYYLMSYVKQNAGILSGDSASVDMVQRYSQVVKSVLLNETMIVMIATCVVGIVVVYLIRRLSINYAWNVAIAAGCVAQLATIFIGDFAFSVAIPAGQLLIGMILSVLLAFVYNFLIFSVDYTRTEYVQYEDDDYYYYVKAVPKMAVSTPDVKVQKISTRKRGSRSVQNEE